MTIRLAGLAWGLAATLALSPSAPAQPIAAPPAFFGFEMGADGELARYPRVVAYLRHLAARSDRVSFQVRGTTTNGNPYVLATFSSKANLDRLDRLVEINHRLADPRGLSDGETAALAREGVPFYFLYATIHSTEVGNGQTIVRIAHRLATDDSAAITRILDNAVILLVPSQNPDGQVLVVDHWYETEGTGYDRVYPDLYHRYAGHDANRDWFMFTQTETRLALGVHREFKPHVTHDMHQMGATGPRMFVPPYDEPHDPNIHPLILRGQAAIGSAMASALRAAGKTGVIHSDLYDLWTPARQYMVYHGQPRILTEIASARLADPLVNPAGLEHPLGPQRPSGNFPAPYDSAVWTLGDIVEYGEIAVFAALEHLAGNGPAWLESFSRVHREWVERDEPPYAFVVPAAQKDPYETYELLQILHLAEVEVHSARASFTAGGTTYPEGSWVIQLAQPYGAFAKTMLERQVYPDRRYYPGGPPIPPYDVTAHTLGLLMGVEVDQIDEPVAADLDRLDRIAPPAAPLPPRPEWAYAIAPVSNAAFQAVTALQAAGIPVMRTGAAVTAAGRQLAPGTWIVPARPEATSALAQVTRTTGLEVTGLDHPVDTFGYRIASPTRVGLWRAANNEPGGWMMWLFERYGLDHEIVSSRDFEDDLSAKYDVIVLPSGTTRGRMVSGLSPVRHDETWRWAYGIGPDGWDALRQWVLDGGTLVAVGTAVHTARDLLDLPLEPVLPTGQLGGRVRVGARSRERFFCPGSLLAHEHDPAHPVAFGMPRRWPVFFRFDQAYAVRPHPRIRGRVASRYPDDASLTASGWVLGEHLLRGHANVVSFSVGDGTAVTIGSQVSFRAQTRATFKLLFNAIFHGPSARIGAAELARLE